MNIATHGCGSEEAAMQAYFREGEARAMALGNRGPLRLTAEGKLHPDIVEAYNRTGFYVIEGLLGPNELIEVKADVHATIDRIATDRDSKVDRQGRPALGTDLPNPVVTWSKPLGDPLGGTKLAGGRAPVKMIEPDAGSDAPKEVPMVVLGSLQFSEAVLRVAGHPGLLAIAEATNGDDFVPFSETVIIKQPGQGGSFAWHQDGATHWGKPNWHQGIHGVNLMVQLYPCTAANAVWFVPGSHLGGKYDIEGAVERAGSNRLPDAVPLICNGGDVCISNRQILHGSFPNVGDSWRITLTMGFHPRHAVLDIATKDVFGNPVVYDAGRVNKRAEMIGYAVEARHQHFPQETPYRYRPQAEAGQLFQWDAAARDKVKNYQALDLFI